MHMLVLQLNNLLQGLKKNMCLYTSGYLTVSRQWYFNVHFRFLSNVSRFLKV